MKRIQRRSAAKTGNLPTGGAARAPDRRQIRAGALVEAAVRYYQAGQLREASRVCRQLLAVDPGNLPALHLTGLMAVRAGLNEAAINTLGAALALNDNIPDRHGTIAYALQRVDRLEEALTHYRRAIALEPNYVEALYNCGNVLLKLRRNQEALACYNRAVAIEPGFAEAVNNRGTALFELKRYAAALADFERALAIKPRFVDALANRGTALIELKRHAEGIASCNQALAISPTDVTALANRGNGLSELRRYAEAVGDFERLLTVNPDYAYAAGKALYYRLLYCDWSNYDRAIESIASRVAAGERATIPFMFLNLSDSVGTQMQCAQTFSRDKYPASDHSIWRGERYDHAKIRVAYLSADFRHHPMAYLMAGVFEAHDKSRFEPTAISFGADPKDDFRKRLERAFDRFFDVQSKNDRDIALLLRELEIDIAVDLIGYTNNGHPAILTFRPAPIQVNYLGFAGTMGADHIDYIIADRFIIPEEYQSFYTEKVAYLPDTYLPTDSKRTIDERTPTRAEAGLPERGFVFCCFNQNYKIAPPMFDVWARLLLQVQDSVLWLVEDNAAAARNLRQEASRRGVAADRLVFAPRVAIGEYLARFRLADLFLDTLPFNAHTTASDALWAGLPVVTCAGSSFASRVAGSLLSAIGLPELITTNLADYEALVLTLAREKHTLERLRSALARNRLSSPLFDTKRFTRYLESAYQMMWGRYQRGEAPAGFIVEREP